MAAGKNTRNTPPRSDQPKPARKPLPPLWTFYRVRWVFLTRLCASVPARPELIEEWLRSRQPRVQPPGAMSIAETNEEVNASIARGEDVPDQSYSMLVFQRHDGRLVERAATTKAHIKDCAAQLRRYYIGRIEGELTLDHRVKNGVYPDERVYWIPILRLDGTSIQEADGAYDKPIHVYVPGRGLMNALKRFEYVEPPSMMEFTLKVLTGTVIEDDLRHIFNYGGTHGYAGERSDGEGRYTYELAKIEDAATGTTKESAA